MIAKKGWNVVNPYACKVFREIHLNSYNNVNTKLSLCAGPTGVKLLDTTIGQNLRNTSTNFPNSIALISCHQNRKVTYEEFNIKVSEVAKSLVSLNLSKGSKIGVYAPNCEEWVLLQYACARIGFILVNVNPSYQVKDLRYALDKIEINALFMPRYMKSSNYIDIMQHVVGAELLTSRKQNPYSLLFPNLKHLRHIILMDDKQLDINLLHALQNLLIIHAHSII